MSRCFIEGMGGGAENLFAAIGVTYPAGSTLTCYNGSKTFKAKTTTGQWVFAIPEAGTWTVTATDGTNSKSQSVRITSEGQVESVRLIYPLYLVKNGVMNEEYVFQKNSGNSTATTVDGVLRVVILDNQYATWYTSKQIPLADYSYATIKIAGGAARYNVSFGVLTSKESFDEEDGSPFGTNRVSVKNGEWPYTIDAQTLNFDLSNINESMYFGLSIAGTSNLDDPVYVHSGLDIEDLMLVG